MFSFGPSDILFDILRKKCDKNAPIFLPSSGKPFVISIRCTSPIIMIILMAANLFPVNKFSLKYEKLIKRSFVI